MKRKADIQKEPTWSHQENDLLHIAEMYVPESTYRIRRSTLGRSLRLVWTPQKHPLHGLRRLDFKKKGENRERKFSLLHTAELRFPERTYGNG
jgi:hypothetical protein